MDSQTRERVSLLFGALAHPMRVTIVEKLIGGPMAVGDLASSVGISQSGASQHLAILTRAGVLAVEPKGNLRFYKVRGPRMVKILTLIEEFCHVHTLYGHSEDNGHE